MDMMTYGSEVWAKDKKSETNADISKNDVLEKTLWEEHSFLSIGKTSATRDENLYIKNEANIVLAVFVKK